MPDTPPEKAPRSDRPTLPQARPTVPSPPRVAPDTSPPSAGELAPRPSVALQGRTLAGRYTVLGPLGAGGMGEVHRAWHATLGIEVAVKLMHDALLRVPEHAHRFRREAQALSRIQHRNVVRVIDFGEDQGRPFLVMELLRGHALADRIDPSVLLPVDEVGDLIGQILEALDAAHTMGVIHRDLKPENVFLTVESDGRPIVKLVDFGLARVEDPGGVGATLTRPGLLSGTPEYMSPEQCRSLTVGPGSDLYAAGCVLTELLQGRPPFEGAHIDILAQHMFAPIPPLRRPAGAPPVPPLLEELRVALLSKEPGWRPATAREARERLRRAMSSEEPVTPLSARAVERRSDLPARGALVRGTLPSAGVRSQESPSGERARVALVRVGPRKIAGNVDEACAVALASLGIDLSDEATDVEPRGVRAIVLDAGPDVDLAIAWMAKISPRLPVIVCLAASGRVASLVAAGFKDLVTYPVTSDVLGRKLRRLAARDRR